LRIQPADDLTMMQQHDPISHPGYLIQMLADTKTEIPSSLARIRSSWRTRTTPSGSRLLLGSSRTRTSGR